MKNLGKSIKEENRCICCQLKQHPNCYGWFGSKECDCLCRNKEMNDKQMKVKTHKIEICPPQCWEHGHRKRFHETGRKGETK